MSENTTTNTTTTQHRQADELYAVYTGNEHPEDRRLLAVCESIRDARVVVDRYNHSAGPSSPATPATYDNSIECVRFYRKGEVK